MIKTINNIRLINTRPTSLNCSLTQRLRKEGFLVKDFPLMQIKPVKANLKLSLDSLHMIIFISQNAVEYFFSQFSETKLSQSCLSVAIGLATAKAYLHKTHNEIDVLPDKQFDSEHLLLRPEFQKIKGKNILIVRGVGGREYLYNELHNSGAIVEYCEVYQRNFPEYTFEQVNNMILDGYYNILLIFSSESLSNLLQLIDEQSKMQLLTSHLIVIHEKIKQKAQTLGFCGIIDVIPTKEPSSLVNYLKQIQAN
ncbi:MAG: uroporphyrinogen-III synthase [Gammaproteobacteria bacterium]|nr:uroporphyrinogen-III synthase [Gammaproteobacteria bacterium]